MRWASLAAALALTGHAHGQIPDQGKFDYVVYDKADRPVGTYSFTIGREGPLWRVSSRMEIDTRILVLRIRLKDENSFTHDGRQFQSFQVSYFKDVPLQRTVQMEVSGRRDESGWTVQSKTAGKAVTRQFAQDRFEEVRNLASRLVRPQAVLRPGQAAKVLSLDPLTLEVGEVESRGVGVEAVEFQGRRRELFVMETRAPDGNVRVHKFANGLIYRSQTEDGYALLKSAQLPSF